MKLELSPARTLIDFLPLFLSFTSFDCCIEELLQTSFLELIKDFLYSKEHDTWWFIDNELLSETWKEKLSSKLDTYFKSSFVRLDSIKFNSEYIEVVVGVNSFWLNTILDRFPASVIDILAEYSATCICSPTTSKLSM